MKTETIGNGLLQRFSIHFEARTPGKKIIFAPLAFLHPPRKTFLHPLSGKKNHFCTPCTI